MGIQVQPNCCGAFFYNRNRKFKVPGSTAQLHWTADNTGLVATGQDGTTVHGWLDPENHWWYLIRDRIDIVRVRSSNGADEEAVFTGPSPTSDHFLCKPRLLRDEKIAYCSFHFSSGSTTTSYIYTSDLDGSNTTQVKSVSARTVNPFWIAVHQTLDKLYYTEAAFAGSTTTVSLRRMDLDGSNDEALATLQSSLGVTEADLWQIGGFDYENDYLWLSKRGLDGSGLSGLGDAGLYRCELDGTSLTRMLQPSDFGHTGTGSADFVFFGECRPNADGRVYYVAFNAPTESWNGIRSMLPDASDDRLEVDYDATYIGNWLYNLVLGEGYRAPSDLYS